MQQLIQLARRGCMAIAVSALCAFCQQPPPPPVAPPASPPLSASLQQAFSKTGTVRSLNFAPDGDVNGFVLDRDILVLVRPDAEASLSSLARTGSRITVSGYSHSGINVPTVVDAQTLTVNGHTLNVGGPAAGPGPVAAALPPPPGRARRRSAPPPPSADAPPPPPPAAPVPPPAR